MKPSEYKYLVLSDLYRLRGQAGYSEFLRQLLDANLPLHQGNPLLKCTAYPVARLMLSHLVRELGIAIPLDATPKN